MASCGCNGHTGSTGKKPDRPQDWNVNTYGVNAPDSVYYSKPKVTVGNIALDEDYDKVLTNVNAERYRRSQYSSVLPNVPDVFEEGERIDASDYNSLVSGLNAVYNSGISTIGIGTLINANDLNTLADSIYTAGTQCVCNCNYCTCNCNACTCNCNYSCTCNCNYNWSDETLKTNIEYL